MSKSMCLKWMLVCCLFKSTLSAAAVMPMVEQLEQSAADSTVMQKEKPLEWGNAKTRKFILSTLNKLTEEGLDPKDYDLDKLNFYEAAVDTLSGAHLHDYNTEFSRQLQCYLSQLAFGKLNPLSLYKDWDLSPLPVDIETMMTSLAQGDSIGGKIGRLQPNHVVYKSLKRALQLIDSYPTDTIGCIEIRKVILKHDKNPALKRIKQKLMYWKDLGPDTILNTVYDDPTFLAIKKFQMRHGLHPDGIIGYRTVEALNFSKNRRREQIIANLERWKWFPRNLGDHYIIINIPEFYLTVVKNNDTIETKRVVVGTLNRRTAILSSTLSNVTFNPTWTVPPTILEEDVLPEALKKRSYFASKNIVIYDKNNRIVSPWSWNHEKYKDYRYVQSPADDNALGNVKFNFPNRYSVYLHDTNHRDYFASSYRSLSSGCVRVENPLPLAQYLLGDQKWTMERICDIVATKKTTAIKLKDKIHIHQLYWTAWLDKEGILQFRTDIYNLDDELYEKLRNEP